MNRHDLHFRMLCLEDPEDLISEGQTHRRNAGEVKYDHLESIEPGWMLFRLQSRCRVVVAASPGAVAQEAGKVATAREPAAARRVVEPSCAAGVIV